MKKIYLISLLVTLGLARAEVKAVHIELPQKTNAVAFVETRPAVDFDMVVAYVIPSVSKQWFVKAMIYSGEEKQVTPLMKLLARTLVIDESQLKACQFELPKGWREVKGSAMIYTTLVNEKLRSRVTISTASGSLLDNVNRWGQQLGLASLEPNQMSSVAIPISINGRFAVVVSLISDEVKAQRKSILEGKDLKKSCYAFSYTHNPSWEDLGKSGMRIVNLRASSFQVSAIALPKSYQQVTANVNRWRRQVGLGAESAESITNSKVEMTISGKPASMWQIKGSTKTILITMVTFGDKVWFLKMIGATAEVLEAKPAYLSFLKSIAFKE